MLNGYIITSSILAIVFVLLGMAVLYRNTRAVSNRLFMVFSSAIALWLVTNYLGSTATIPHNIALASNKLVFIFAIISTLTLLTFARNLTGAKFHKGLKSLVILNCISIIAALSPWVVVSINAQSATYAIKFGMLAPVYFVTLLINFIVTIESLVLGRRKSHGVQRLQIDTIFVSLAITLGAILITNALLPVAFSYYGLTNAGSFFSAVLVSGMAYSIVRHKLFDLRLVIARSLAYALSVLVVVSVFVAVVFGVSNYIFDVRIPTNQEIYIGIFSAVIALSFQSIKSIFDRFSSKLFYRNAYDPQDFLDRLSNITTNTIDLVSILHDSSVLIIKDLKIQTCEFVLLNPDGNIFEYLPDNKRKDKTYESLSLITRNNKRILLYGDETIEPKLKHIMGEIGAEALVPLDSNKARVGFIVLGLKSSGQSYNNQDLKVLSIGADSLAVSIQNALRFEEISRFNVTLQEKIDEATYQLRRANEKLKALDESKDDFISMASHQLRTPLTSIKGYISMVLEGDAGKVTPTQSEMLGQAFFSSQRMVYLISDLLNVSRLKTGKFVIEKSQINLATMVGQELKQLQETADSRHLTLSFEHPDDFPDLMLDETKTRQVIMNFVDNAIYYTPAGGHIKVRLIDNPSTVELRVEDDGIGVSKSDQHHLFTKFYRAGNARKARPDGTGLGLFMAKKVIIAEEGSLIFESVEGKGSTFGFVFSKSKVGVPK